MGLCKKSTCVLCTLKDFTVLVEKLENGNWRLTDAGKRVIKNDHTALIEVFSKNPMFRELLDKFPNLKSFLDFTFKWVDECIRILRKGGCSFPISIKIR